MPPLPQRAAVPQELLDRGQWVAWRFEQANGKPTKVPTDPHTGGNAKSTVPASWGSFDQAVAAVERYGCEGVGFVVTAHDDIVGIDLDDCVSGEGGPNAGASKIIENLNSYTEITPSGRGFRVYIRGTKPSGAKCRVAKRNGCRNIEIYENERFFTFSGNHLAGTPTTVEPRQLALEALCTELWPPKAASTRGPTPVGAGFSGDDAALVSLASRARNAEKFTRLWNGDISGYPSASEADLALCSMLAFYAGADPQRIERLMRASGLARDKWDRDDYFANTIAKALEGRTEFYEPGASSSPSASDEAEGPIGDDGLARLGFKDPTTGRLILSPRRTLPTAAAFVREFHIHSGFPTLVSYCDMFMEWRDNHYVEVEGGAIRKRLFPWLHDAARYVYNRQTQEYELEPFEANPTTVKAALDSIRDRVHLSHTMPSPSWLLQMPADPDPKSLLACRSGTLLLPSRTLVAPTPRLFTTTALSFDYEPDPEPPLRWVKFMEQVFGDDLDAMALLQDWMGYCLSADTSQQKILLVVGPRRSGKGTIARILARLIGLGNVAGPTTGGLAGPFGLQPLIGKSLAIVSDARFHGEGMAIVVERLLCISGEDALTIDRKHLPSLTMKLPTRLVLLTNEVPRLTDASNALAGRFVVLRLTQSFYGRENPRLTEELAEELPGILSWALDGLDRLRKRGFFVQPESGKEAIEDLEDLGSPVSAFVRARCTVGPGLRARLDDLYVAWRDWCHLEGRDFVAAKPSFARDLFAAVAGLQRRRGTGDVPFYEGIGLGRKQGIPV